MVQGTVDRDYTQAEESGLTLFRFSIWDLLRLRSWARGLRLWAMGFGWGCSARRVMFVGYGNPLSAEPQT